MYLKIQNKNIAETIKFLQKAGISYELSSSTIPFLVRDEVEQFSLKTVADLLDKDLIEYYQRPVSEAPMLTPEQLYEGARQVDLLTVKPLEELQKRIPVMTEILSKNIQQVIQTHWDELMK